MHRHRRRTSELQPDLFPPPQPLVAAGGPGWSNLPNAAQQAVTALMTRLLIAHAADAASRAEGDGDER